MRRAPSFAAVLAVLVSLVPASCSRADSPEAQAAPASGGPGRSAPAESALTLQSVAWMAGSWRGESEGTRQEEHWLAPDGRIMLGLHRDVSPKGASFEYLRIEQDERGVVYHASPGGAPSTPFRLIEAGPARAVFANPQHDFPKRIIYALQGDVLTARIEGDGPEGMEWSWKRAAMLP